MKKDICLYSRYKSTIDLSRKGDNIELSIPITLEVEEIEKIMDILNLDDIVSYLYENYHLNEIEEKLNKIKELENE